MAKLDSLGSSDLPEELKKDDSLKGFVRMVEYLKTEKKKKLAANPELYLRRHKLKQYQEQIDEPGRSLSKGLQLDKAA